jgi:uncharacterized protein (DUF58 family)
VPLFDADFLTQLECLALISRRVFQGQLLAQRRGSQTGGGVEFADHRPYGQGDDFRYIDWNLYARLNSLLLKRFQEERDLHVYLLLDCSRSMGFGTPPKFDFARRVAAALAYVVLSGLDRASVVGIGGAAPSEFPLTRGKGRILTLMRYLEGLAAEGGRTNLAQAASAFVLRRRPGLAVLISDLYDPDGFAVGLDVLRHRRYDVHVVHVHDRAEADPSLSGDVELLDVESGAALDVTVSQGRLRRYREVFRAYLDAVRAYCRRHGLSLVSTPADVPFQELILQMMRASVAGQGSGAAQPAPGGSRP